MDQRLIAVLRQPRVMLALVSTRRYAFDPVTVRDDGPYVELVRPLAQVDEKVCPWRDRDVKVWRALGAVPELSERAALAIVRALIGSVADPLATVGELPELNLLALPRDLRPHLCSGAGEQTFVDALASVLEDTPKQLGFPAWHWTRRAELFDLEPEFRRMCLWTLHLSEWPLVTECVQLYRALKLDEDGRTRSAMARLLSRSGGALGVAWWRALLEVAPDRRTRAVELILESGAFRCQPVAETLGLLASAPWHEAHAGLVAQLR